MPVWVPELDMLYVLVPRTGSTAFRRYLRLRYDAIDLTMQEAVDAGLVQPDNQLRKHSDFAQLALDFRPPVPRHRLVRVAGVRNPADSLFSAWWKYAHTYPQRLERIDELPEPDQHFLRSEAVAERMQRIGGIAFSDWVLDLCTSLIESKAVPNSRLDEVRDGLWSFARLRKTKLSGGMTAPKRAQEIWYEGAAEYLRVEDCNADWERICRQRGWSHRGQIPVFNATDGRPVDYSPYLTEEAAALLRRTFRRMIERFGYEIRSSSAS